MKTFSHKLTDSNIYAHLLYRIHPEQEKCIDDTGILSVLENTVQTVNQHLHHQGCNIVIVVDPESTIPEEGIGGFAWGPDYIKIALDIDHKIPIREIITEHLPPTLAHELHHARRDKDVGYGDTLGEALITEGLACAFEEMLHPGRLVQYAHNLSNKELVEVSEKARPLLGEKDYNHALWFFSEDGDIKRWAGYSLGYDIVKRYMEATSKDPAQLVNTPAKNILAKAF